MNNPENFILTTDFATLKQDGVGTITINVPGSISIPASGSYSYIQTADIEVGTAGAGVRSKIATSRQGGRLYNTTKLVSFSTGKAGAFNTTYSTDAYISRVSPTTLRAVILIPNSYGTTLVTSPTPELFTFKFSTFLPPF